MSMKLRLLKNGSNESLIIEHETGHMFWSINPKLPVVTSLNNDIDQLTQKILRLQKQKSRLLQAVNQINTIGI